MPRARANPSTAQTNTELVPVQAGHYVRVSSVYVSAMSPMVVTLVSGTTHSVLWRAYLENHGRAVLSEPFESPLGEGVDYTTSDDGDVYIDVEYRYVGPRFGLG